MWQRQKKKEHADSYLFGFFTLINNITSLINYLLLSARFLIYKCKTSNTKPSISMLFHSLNMSRKAEYVFAKRNNLQDEHYRKWCLL